MTATVFSVVRYRRRKSRKSGKFRRKVAIAAWCVLAIAGFFAVNFAYQVMRKPVEIFAPISGSFAKSPASTWESYGELFKEHSTNIISAEFLAALAQVESDGNPVARTYWRWQWSSSPFEVYRPASSATGMFQMTDGTFVQARKYCIRDRRVASEGSQDPGACSFNSLYTRIVPSHAVEMTAAYLHKGVVDILARRPVKKASAAQKQKLAAVIHLCGLGRGESFAARGFRAAPGEHCGSHSLQGYLTRIESMKKRFAQLAAN